jgi:hypothetical protein
MARRKLTDKEWDALDALRFSTTDGGGSEAYSMHAVFDGYFSSRVIQEWTVIEIVANA